MSGGVVLANSGRLPCWAKRVEGEGEIITL